MISLPKVPRIKAAEDNDDASEAMRRLLRYALGFGLAGAAGATTVHAVRNTNSRYDPPKAPDPLVVDIPYPASAPPKKQLKVANRPEWSEYPGVSWIYDNLVPAYTPPAGRPGQPVQDVPLFSAGIPIAGAAGLGLGYAGANKLLGAAERWGAEKDLEAAKKEYQESLIRRLTRSDLPTKSAATDTPTAEAAPVKSAVDELYATVKAAADAAAGAAAGAGDDGRNSLLRTLTSALFPGLVAGDQAARINMAIAGGAGVLGGYGGYSVMRDKNLADENRRAVAKVDRDHARALPQPIVGRLVPVPA